MTEIIPFKRPSRPQDLVLRFLNSVGHKRDADFYLKLFTSTRPESFAIIVVDEEILRDEIDAILFEIRYLMRLSLYPVVLIRSSSDFLEKLDVESYFKRANISLNFLSDAFTNDEKIEFVKERIKRQTLPLLHLNPDLDMAEEITRLANLLKTSKVIFLRKSGGVLHEQDNELIRIINLKFEKEKHFNRQDSAFLKMCETILDKSSHKVVIAIVSPNNLLRELFTVKGAGTLIQRGSTIMTHHNWDKIDPRSLKRLLEMSFEQRISEDFFNEKIDRFYIEENYMGAALLKEHRGMSYLSKFAVGIEARGLGIGRDLWHEIIKNHQKFFWRSKSEKFITHWYSKQCDGMHKAGEWTVFWKGIESAHIKEAIDYALAQKVDFK